MWPRNGPKIRLKGGLELVGTPCYIPSDMSDEIMNGKRVNLRHPGLEVHGSTRS